MSYLELSETLKTRKVKFIICRDDKLIIRFGVKNNPIEYTLNVKQAYSLIAELALIQKNKVRQINNMLILTTASTHLERKILRNINKPIKPTNKTSIWSKLYSCITHSNKRVKGNDNEVYFS